MKTARVATETYTSQNRIDIVMWLSGGCTTSEPLPEGRPPPFACVYGYALSRFVQIYPNVYQCYGMHMQGGGSTLRKWFGSGTTT